jgi:hypothetical protein
MSSVSFSQEKAVSLSATNLSKSENSSKICNLVVSTKIDNADVRIFLANSCFEVPEYIHIENGDKIIVIDYIFSMGLFDDTRRKFVVRSNVRTSFEIANILKETEISDEMIKIIEELCMYQMIPDRTLKSITYLENNGSEHQVELAKNHFLS